MKIQRAVITAAGRNQRTLPLQRLIDRDGEEKTVLQIILNEVRSANVHEICIVIAPGDEEAYARAAGDRSIRFLVQEESAGYAHAVLSAQPFTKDDPFLHLVGDHLYVGEGAHPAQRLVRTAEEFNCSVSAVQATRESLLPLYGTIGGKRLPGKPDLYRVERVIEKPTPTEAEQTLTISGLRGGHYLCFFGMHVLTPKVLEILAGKLASQNQRVTLSDGLAELAGREQYLALEQTSHRYDVGIKYGLFRAQLALALGGKDRSAVLGQLLEVIAVSTTEAQEVVRGV
jgi:UTP--glucose-1-phosphate uridylyltransferase